MTKEYLPDEVPVLPCDECNGSGEDVLGEDAMACPNCDGCGYMCQRHNRPADFCRNCF